MLKSRPLESIVEQGVIVLFAKLLQGLRREFGYKLSMVAVVEMRGQRIVVKLGTGFSVLFKLRFIQLVICLPILLAPLR